MCGATERDVYYTIVIPNVDSDKDAAQRLADAISEITGYSVTVREATSEEAA